jgi:hypothetical protein
VGFERRCKENRRVTVQRFAASEKTEMTLDMDDPAIQAEVDALRAEYVRRRRLYEAAPELLAAGEGLLRFLRVSVNAGPISNNPRMEMRHLEKLRAAIAKATGAA